MKKAVFLDKDGTLVGDVPYNADPALVFLLPGVIEGLRSLQAAGYRLVVVSNQSGVALGYFTEVELTQAIRELWTLLEAGGVYLMAFYYCPHAEEGTVMPYACSCGCRKPQPGLLQNAAHDLDISLTDSWMIGDILHDTEAGRRAGCHTVLVNNGNETEWVMNEWRQPDFIVRDLVEAAEIILQEKMHRVQPPF